MLLLLQSTPPHFYYTSEWIGTAFGTLEEDDDEDLLYLLWYEFMNYHG